MPKFLPGEPGDNDVRWGGGLPRSSMIRRVLELFSIKIGVPKICQVFSQRFWPRKGYGGVREKSAHANRLNNKGFQKTLLASDASGISTP